MKYFYTIVLLVFTSCTHTVNVKNEKKGKLKAVQQLALSGEKKIPLDVETAPQPPYIQMIKGVFGEPVLTFLNPHMNAIYFYDYKNVILNRIIEYEKQGPDGILRFGGYFIKNMDSIYVYNTPLTEIALTDSSGHVKQRISLIDSGIGIEAFRYYP